MGLISARPGDGGAAHPDESVSSIAPTADELAVIPGGLAAVEADRGEGGEDVAAFEAWCASGPITGEIFPRPPDAASSRYAADHLGHGHPSVGPAVGAADCFVRYGPARRTVADVAALAGCSRPTVYKHVGDRGGIAEALLEREWGRMRRAVEAELGRHAGPVAKLGAAVVC